MSHCHFPFRNHKEITLVGVLVTSYFTPLFLSSISIPSQQPSNTLSLDKIQGRDLLPPSPRSSQARITTAPPSPCGTGALSASQALPANG